MKFKEQLRIIEEALLKPMSDELAQKLDEEKIKIRLDEIKKRSTLNADGSYDVDGGVDLSNTYLTKFPMKFGKVSGHFDCSYNKLITLKGAPIEVGKSFYAHYNKLTSLEGAPKKVGGAFNCFANTIKFTEDEVRAVCDVKGKIYE